MQFLLDWGLVLVVFGADWLEGYSRNMSRYLLVIKFDDLKSPICRFESRQPDVDPKQIHIVMWESFKQSEIHGENSSRKALLKKVKMVAESNKHFDKIAWTAF
jgi:hypothetical protein